MRRIYRNEYVQGPTDRFHIPWHRAPVPPFFHRCRTWSRATDRALREVEWCPCGGQRHDGGRWQRRNSRRFQENHGIVCYITNWLT
jgi:hypothetical protein